jgi:NAD+ kinase
MVVEQIRPAPIEPSHIGLVVHPSRAIDRPLAEVRQWADRHGVDVVQVDASCEQQQVAPPGRSSETDLILAIGGDGTTLAAIRAGALAARPVMGVACGSLGVLTSVAPGGVAAALERFIDGDWIAQPLPALDVARDSEQPLFALNDVAVVRAGTGQVRVTAEVDGTLFARIAGDGCVLSTPIGSSAYSLAAGGPLLAPGAEAFLLTPLPTHGGSCPPLVLGPGSSVRLDVGTGPGGARLELDGQVIGKHLGRLTVGFRPDVAALVTFADQEPFLAGLRRRRIVTDSPRILAEDAP